MKYYIGKDGRQLGPYEAAQVREQLALGTLSPDDLVWRQGLPDWVPLHREFPSATPPPIPADVATPPPATAPNPFVAAVPRDTSSARAYAHASAPSLASRGSRLLARVIDAGLALLAFAPGMIWFFSALAAMESTNGISSVQVTALETTSGTDAVSSSASSLGGAILLTIVLVLGLLIVQTILLSTRGQTLGKKFVGVRIVRSDGSEPGFVHAVLLRAIVMGMIDGIVGVTALINPLLIFREDRRCLHDLIADTRVIAC
jgi:uncharacterized RDD family membrane protein YckC